MKEVKIIKDLTPNDCNIKWRMTNFCNIHCSYCIRFRHRVELNDVSVIEDEDKLCSIAKDISDLIDTTSFTNVKLNLIGGEVSIFNLKKIISNITSSRIKVISLTSNCIRDTNYYSELADYLHLRGIEFTVRFSCHYEFITLEKYFEKIEALKDKIDRLTCEIVSNRDNQELVKEFVKHCEESNVNYTCDADIRKQAKPAREHGLNISSKCINRNPRYKITFTDGTEQIFETRNQFITSKEIEGTKDLKFIHTQGMYCTNSYNYIYIDFDKVNGRSSLESGCHEMIPVKDFKFLEEPALCKTDYCTICGHFDLFKDY